MSEAKKKRLRTPEEIKVSSMIYDSITGTRMFDVDSHEFADELAKRIWTLFRKRELALSEQYERDLQSAGFSGERQGRDDAIREIIGKFESWISKDT